MPFAAELAARANAIRLSELPRDAIHTAKRAIVDTLGVSLAGSRVGFVDTVESAVCAPQDTGSCTKIGRRGRCSPLQAAVINGVSAHALDFDDCSITMGGHPSAPIVPPALALAEERASSGAELLQAFVAGFETETHLARALMPQHYETGWHPTATLGVFGATAACSRLLGLGNDELATAFCIAVSLTGGLRCNFGTPVKPLHVGQAAHNGLLAALLAAGGFEANLEAFEHDQGFFNVINGSDSSRPHLSLSDWTDDLEILAPGISIKQHGCCGSAHSAIDAATKLYRCHGPIDTDRIRRIEIQVHERRLPHIDRPDPRSALDAKFSVQFLTAAALRRGRIRLSDFSEGGPVVAPELRSILDRIQAFAHRRSDEYFAEVRILTAEGATLQASASTSLGRGADNPMSDDELLEKYVECAAPQLGDAGAKQTFFEIFRMEEMTSVSDMVRQLAPDARHDRRALS